MGEKTCDTCGATTDTVHSPNREEAWALELIKGVGRK